jgi:tripartite-type tricarboxylate transporter receptor subunit TctC
MKFRFKFAAALCSIAFSAAAFAQYPDRPIKILVPFAPGGVADLLARVVAQKITEQTGKTVIVDNKTGAGGRIGYDAGAKAPPDGYTFTATDVTYTMMPALYKSLPWNPSTDLAPVALLAQMPFVVAVRDNAGMNTLPQLVAKARTSGTKLNFGSAGVGSVNHVVTELFSKSAGVQMVNVPYRGMGEAISGLLGGSVDVLVTAMPTAMGQVQNGRIRALAVTAPMRSPALPDVPTTTEAGVKFEASNWIGLTAPKNTPPEALAWMQKAVASAVSASDVKQNFLRQGAEAAVGSTREGFEHLMRSETARWAEVIHAAKITPEQ